MRHRLAGPLLPSLFSVLVLSPCIFPQSAADVGKKLRFTVVVTDAQGVPIRNLKADDFELQIAGKPVPKLVKGSVGEEGTNGRGLIVVVIDGMHTQWQEEKDLRLNAGKYLAACAKRDLPVSLLFFSRDGALIPVHEYKASSATLTSALEQADAELHNTARAGTASLEVIEEAQRLFDFFRGQGKYSTQSAIEQYPGAMLGAFKNVAQYVGRIPGRKTLVWISSTFPFAVDEKHGRILSPTTTSLAPGDLIYPNLLTADQVKQLQVVWKDSIGAALSSELALYPVQTRATATTPLNPEVINSMTSLAHMTGGVEVHSVGDFFGQFLQLAEQSRAAYEFEVMADAARNCKSEWCAMTVSVKHPGARVLAPRGFFPETSFVSGEMPSVPASASEPIPGPDSIPFTVTWKPSEVAGVKRKVEFIVAFGPEAGIPTAGSRDLNVEVIVHAFADGADKQSLQFVANKQLPDATLNEIHAKGFVLNNAIELDPGEYTVRFVVHDKLSGRMGVLKLPLKVGS